jgi:uncharacterized protein YlxP (DUF503 family)
MPDIKLSLLSEVLQKEEKKSSAISTSIQTGYQDTYPKILYLAVCCASRLKPKKIADQAIFYLANCNGNEVSATGP